MRNRLVELPSIILIRPAGAQRDQFREKVFFGATYNRKACFRGKRRTRIG